MVGDMAARNAFMTSTFRAIRGSMGRFLAIMGITALGCGFFAGLQMCGPDMRSAADAWYDGSRVWDLRLISTMGWSDDDVARIASLDGIENVMPAKSLDAMARLGGEQLAVRISTLNVNAAKASTALDTTRIVSDDANYLNRMRLIDGRWPDTTDECVVCADATLPGFGIGSTVDILATAEGSEELLRTKSFTVVGTVTSAAYPYTANFGSTTLGAGMIEQYLYVNADAMSTDTPYTDVFAVVKSSSHHESESDTYQNTVQEVAHGVTGNADMLMDARLSDLRSKAQAELDTHASELADAKLEAEQKLADGKAELDHAADELALGETQLADGEAQYAANRAAYERERASALSQLDAAAAELFAGESQLAAGEAELIAGKERLDAGESELNAHTKELLAALAAQGLAASSLEEASSSVAAARTELESGLMLLDETDQAIAQLRAGESYLREKEAQLEELTYVYESCAAALIAQGYPQANVDAALAASPEWAAQLEAVVQEDEGGDELVSQIETMAAVAQQLLGLKEALAGMRSELTTGIEGLLFALAEQGMPVSSLDEASFVVAGARSEAESNRARLDDTQSAIEQLKALTDELAQGRMELDNASMQLATHRAQLASGKSELAEQRDAAMQQLAYAAEQLDEGAARLVSSRDQLTAGRAEWQRGMDAWEASRAEADASFGSIEAELAEGQDKIHALLAGELYVLDRTKNEGAATYHADTERMDAIAAVFPLMFFLVAALVALTTMTRMVEDERVQIGTFKALGYSTAKIASRYLAYAALASLLGATLGILILSQVLPTIVISSYGIIYAVPKPSFPLPLSIPVILFSGGLGVSVTLLATWAAVVTSLREAPSTLMLPRPPVAGRRILLERIGILWRRLSFSWKVTLRNIFRYKRRLFMTVIGVSGCTALLLVGFGLHDAIWDIIDCQYGPIVHYDTTVGLDAKATESEVDDVARYLTETGEVDTITRIHTENMQASGADESQTMRAQVVVPKSTEEQNTAVTLRERVGHAPISFDENSVVVTEKLAARCHCGVGDVIKLFYQDATGNAMGEGHELVVSGITENYVGNIVYVGRSAWAKVDPKVPVFSVLHATTTPGEDVRSRITDALHDYPHVSTVAFSDETIALYRTMLSVVDLIVVVLIVSAGALAFIVLYNLTNINVAERVREIASLKVLGFTRREVYAYIFREVFLLAIAGALLGLVLGSWLASFVITTAEVDYVMFGRSIHPPSYLYAFALTLVFTAAIALVMRSKLDRVSMVESLKSVD